MAITQRRLRQLQQLIQEGREHEFYLWEEWRGSENRRDGLRDYVLRMDHNECQE